MKQQSAEKLSPVTKQKSFMSQVAHPDPNPKGTFACLSSKCITGCPILLLGCVPLPSVSDVRQCLHCVSATAGGSHAVN